MAYTATNNPYEPASPSSDVIPVGVTRAQAVLVALLAIVLLLRGGYMLFSWGLQLYPGFLPDSHFYAAVVTKDVIYGISAFIGGLMLLTRNRIGWWFALVHWCWYVACEIIVVATGLLLGWRVPVHNDPPMLYHTMIFAALVAIFGLSVLLWPPVATACKAPTAKRFLVLLKVLACSVALAFVVNWWMSLR